MKNCLRNWNTQKVKLRFERFITKCSCMYKNATNEVVINLLSKFGETMNFQPDPMVHFKTKVGTSPEQLWELK